MEYYYSSDKNIQMLIYLLKENNIRKVIVSPGATHIAFIGSLQQDPFFELYSAVDERGAAYMACGLAFESNEPVVITCTGATASRNYMPALTEAFYRKIPILAITAAQDDSNSGQLIPQYVDRTQQPNDLVKLSVSLQEIKDERDEWDCNLKINKALLELRHNGGGPVHINLNCNTIKSLNVKELPKTRVIKKFNTFSQLPLLPENARIAISAGAHKPWNKNLIALVEKFCEENNAVVFIDHASGYRGKYGVLPTLVSTQENVESEMFDIDLLIHIGEHTGDYYTFYKFEKAKEVWRVNEDGELRDTFRHLTNVFEMDEEQFFSRYIKNDGKIKNEYLEFCKSEISSIYRDVPELPFSNPWLAKKIAPQIPHDAVIHFGVSNTFRSWTFFELPEGVVSTANVGARGIDGAISTALGMSLANKDKIHYCILGDLTFFYNMNALGNRQLGNNLRFLLINNGMGAEFRNYQHIGYKLLDEDVKQFVGANGHNGQKSRNLVKHLAQNLGFLYLCATSKEEAETALTVFLKNTITDKPIILEVFTEPENESEALKLIRNVRVGDTAVVKEKIKELLGEKGTRIVKSIFKK